MNRRTFNKLIAGVVAAPTALLLGKPKWTMGVDVATRPCKTVWSFRRVAFDVNAKINHNPTLDACREFDKSIREALKEHYSRYPFFSAQVHS